MPEINPSSAGTRVAPSVAVTSSTLRLHGRRSRRPPLCLQAELSAACCGKVTCEQQQTGKIVSRRSRRAAVRAVVVCLRQGQEAFWRRQARPDGNGEKT